MLATVSRKSLVVSSRSQYAGDLVGGHGRCDSGPVHDDAESHRTRRNELGDFTSDARIVDRVLAVRTVIAHGVAALAQVRFQLFLEVESAVIGAECELHERWARENSTRC